MSPPNKGRPSKGRPSKGRASKRRAKKPRTLTATRLLGALVGSVLVVGFLLVAVFPTRTLLNQRSDTGKAQSELSDLDAGHQDFERRFVRVEVGGEPPLVADRGSQASLFEDDL